MPEVVFAPKDEEPLSVQAPEGGSLADLCDDTNAPIPFSCRSATCATCRIEVLEGEALLDAPQEDELALLAVFASRSIAGFSFRLACQAQMHPGPGRLVVRAVADDEP